jgi:hypothetical protein
MGIKVERYNQDRQDRGSSVLTDEYPEATGVTVDDNGNLTILIEDVFIGDKPYAVDLAIGGYPKDGYFRWCLSEKPEYETPEQRDAREQAEVAAELAAEKGGSK